MEDGDRSAVFQKRPRSVEEDNEEIENKADKAQLTSETSDEKNGDNVDEHESNAPSSTGAETEGDDSEVDEEEILVVLELCDFKNHPLFDDYNTATLEGIDTAKPMLKIGEYELHGQLEETVGTTYFYDTDTSKVPDKKYQFAGQTIKKIKFTIAPPEDV